MTLQSSGYQLLAPLLVASGWALLVLIAEMFSVGRRFAGVAWLTALGLAAVGFCAAGTAGEGVFGDALALDGLTIVVTQIVCVLSILAVFMALDYLPITGVRGGEYYPLLLFAVVGILVMVAATDLIVMFLGLETMSMAVYTLAGIWKRDLRSNEAALKYFLMGAFASGFMLYGIALLYGEAGTTVLAGIARAAGTSAAGGHPSGLLLLGAGLLLVGFGFKVAAVPFHLWTPDAYEGAPTSVTAFMATVVKVGAFAALVRTVTFALSPLAVDLSAVFWIGAAVTMTVGNLVALRQTSLKRMLAYSSIAHTGYLLVGLTAGTSTAVAAMLYYLVVYGAMNLGAFGLMMLAAREGNGAEQIRDYAGLSQRNPMLAAAMTICMLSLTGIPPLGGFLGKLYLFSAAIEAGYVGLVVVAVLNSVVSAAYYLGVVRTMYFDTGGLEVSPGRPYLAVTTALAVLAVVILGITPVALMGKVSSAAGSVLLGH